MSQTASLNDVEVPAIDNIKAQNDLEKGSETSESVKPDAHGNNDFSGDHHDRHDVTNAPIQTDSFKSPPTNDTPASLNEEKSEHSHGQAADAVSMHRGRSSEEENMEELVGLFREILEAVSNPGPGTSSNDPNPAPTKRNMAGRKRLFGLTKGLSPEIGSNNRFNYEQKYPRDQFGEETAENARIWLTYLDEAEAFDRERVEGWKETVDVLLVFAGLFSGVITTFISQASTSLQQDSTQVTASLLFETVQILRAQFSGLPINNVPNSIITPTSPFAPSTNASLVNGLWFTSLAITLSTALFAVLAKQWLYYYMVSISGTANQKVRARQLRFNGFEQWKVAAIVDLLPILLHLAVGLFLTGIILLLFPLDTRIAWTIVAITSITFTLYFISVILPIRYPECPYTTSLTIYAGILFFVLGGSLGWVSMILNDGFRVIWERVNSQAQRTIQHLVRYILDLFRHLFTLISKLARDVCWDLQRHRPIIFSADFPKFTKWREENIKQAVSEATFLDSQAINWLYTASADRSVHRIIARSVAVNPTIAERFERSGNSLSDTLEVSKTNTLDLRYGLCLSLLGHGGFHNHCSLLEYYVGESELDEAEFKAYLCFQKLVSSIVNGSDGPFLDDLITGGGSVRLPLAMWYYVLKWISLDRMVAHIVLKSQGSNLFRYKFDPTRELVDSAGLMSFDSSELGWWKLEYLFHYFDLGKPDFSSETKSYATRYRLFIKVYRQLTSDDPLITNKEERQGSLYDLFGSFKSQLLLSCLDSEYRFTFFKDILCVDSFWSESMTSETRYMAVYCLGVISAKKAILCPFTDYHNLSLIYQWCSRDLDKKLSYYTSSIFTVLLLSSNRRHLSTILLNDPQAASNLSTCLRNLGNRYYSREQGEVIYPLLMDLLESAKMPLFTIFYNSSVLVQLWKLLLIIEQDPKQFFLLLKSKLNKERLDEVFITMNDQERFNGPADSDTSTHYLGSDHSDTTGYDCRLQASLRVFEQIIGRPQELSTSPGAMLDNDHDNEERAQVPGPNERQVFRTVANWTKKAFGNVWSKPLAE